MSYRTFMIAVALWAGLTLWSVGEAEKRGEARAKAAQVDARIDTLRVWVDRVDTLYRDSVRVATKWKTQWDTVRVRDTITVDSVVYVPLAPAESTINACFAVVRNCELRVAARDSLINAQQVSLKLLRDQIPPPSQRWIDRGIGAAIVVALTWAIR